MKIALLNIIVCFSLFACKSDRTAGSDQGNVAKTAFAQQDRLSAIAGWFIGTWSGTMKDGEVYEHWEKTDDSTYSGVGLFLHGKDTLSGEKIKLEARGTTISYIPTTDHQNNNKPVSFTLIQNDSNQLIFENKQHDFPQMITYHLVNRDSIVASISGKVKGMSRTEMFPMHRIIEPK